MCPFLRRDRRPDSRVVTKPFQEIETPAPSNDDSHQVDDAQQNPSNSAEISSTNMSIYSEEDENNALDPSEFLEQQTGS
jgi:hypothetical protein